METEGPQTDQGRGKGPPGSNVVRLRPRDWLGPREELVPFGSGATGEGEQRDGELREGDEEQGLSAELGAESLESPPSASDFWGEHSEVMHGVLQRPTPIIEPASDDSHRERKRSPRAQAGIAWRAARELGGVLVGRVVGTGRALGSARAVRSPRTRAIALIAVGLVGTAAVTVAVRTLDLTAPRHTPSAISAAAAHGSGAANHLPLGFHQLLTTIAERRSIHTQATVRRPQSTRRHLHARHAGKPTARRPAAPVQPATSYVAHTPSAATHRTPVSTDITPVSNSSSTSSASSSGAGSSSGSGGGTSSGPVGPGAPFGPGHLG
jgi:uncharacterized membrane protein YgcG